MYHPIPSSGILHLWRRSTCSFDCANTLGLVAWLQQHGYRALPTRPTLEYARMQQGGALLVLYVSGSVVVQGANADAALQLLTDLEVQ